MRIRVEHLKSLPKERKLEACIVSGNVFFETIVELDADQLSQLLDSISGAAVRCIAVLASRILDKEKPRRKNAKKM